ncbi:MAG: hypothetical protein ABW133_25070 [Polyangiaceae bacterium]
MKRHNLGWLLTICTFSLIPSMAGCGAAPSSTPQEDPPAATTKTRPARRTPAGTPIYDISVHREADGTITTSKREVTPEYREIQSKYRDKQLVAKLQREMLYKDEPDKLASHDLVECDNYYTMWLNTDYEQYGDRVCFYSYDVGMPNTIPSPYANNIYSWWSGVEWGALHDNNHPWGGDCDYLCPFDEDQREDYADALGPYCSTQANQVNQNGYCFQTNATSSQK